VEDASAREPDEDDERSVLPHPFTVAAFGYAVTVAPVTGPRSGVASASTTTSAYVTRTQGLSHWRAIGKIAHVHNT
jgi:hypothetical protein